jgi:lipoprotein-anchoring transpeptidase ErfK/SrfK
VNVRRKVRGLSAVAVALTVSILAGVAGVGADTGVEAGSDPSTTTSTATTTTATTSTTTTTATTTTSTTSSTTTITVPRSDFVGELPSGSTRIAPRRGEQIQVAPTLPPSTTTLPPGWQLPPGSGAGRRVIYSKTLQRVWTVEADGTVSKSHLVSGRQTWNQPLVGTYSVFSRSSYTCNIKNPAICWRYMVRFTKGPSGDNIGFHEIPVDTRTGQRVQSESQLGTPLSSGCVRQATSDAVYIWNWAPIGTQVVVLP